MLGIGGRPPISADEDPPSPAKGPNQHFTGPVDVYLGLYFPALDPDNVYLVTAANTLQPVSAGLTPWRASTAGNIHTKLFGQVPLSALPAGDYTLGVIVMPAGEFATSYLWATTFSP